MLKTVLQNPQMKAMGKDPNMVHVLMDLMKDPEKMEQLTGNADLAQSLSALVEKEPQVLTQVMKEAGFQVGMTLEDIGAATTEEVHAEFVRLSKSDEDTMKQLHKNNGLREVLKKTLGNVVDNAMRDTSRIKTHLGDLHKGRRHVADGELKKKGSLLQSLKSGGLRDFEELGTAEEMESALDELAKQINEKIMGLREQDEAQLQVLEENEKLRAALKKSLQKRIQEQQKELSFATDESGKFNF